MAIRTMNSIVGTGTGTSIARIAGVLVVVVAATTAVYWWASPQHHRNKTSASSQFRALQSAYADPKTIEGRTHTILTAEEAPEAEGEYALLSHGLGDVSKSVTAHTDEHHGVKCCNPEEPPPTAAGWSKRQTLHNVCPYAYTFLDDSECGQWTFAEAAHFCASKGGRLCTALELQNKCAMGNGCGSDLDLVWTYHDDENGIDHSHLDAGLDFPEPVDMVYPWAEHHLKPVEERTGLTKEFAPLYWHIPKSGGTEARSYYDCLGFVISKRLHKQIRGKDTKLVAVPEWGGIKVNTDMTNLPGIIRAEKLGLIPSGIADLVMTTRPKEAIEHLYDEEHRGRAFAVFRHPVAREVSQFYYLQIAFWEPGYKPNWKNVDIVDHMKNKQPENFNLYVKRLSGIGNTELATEEHLKLAMETIRRYFYVGLTEHMGESLHRFNTFMGVDESEETPRKCMNQFFGNRKLGVMVNNHPHPHYEEGSPVWNILAEQNSLDMQLYEFVVGLFHEQQALLELYLQE